MIRFIEYLVLDSLLLIRRLLNVSQIDHLAKYWITSVENYVFYIKYYIYFGNNITYIKLG